MRRVVLRRGAVKVYEGLADEDRERLRQALRALAADPFTSRSGTDIKRLKGTFEREDLYRLRVGRWRAFYAVHADEVIVIDIRRRESAY